MPYTRRLWTVDPFRSPHSLRLADSGVTARNGVARKPGAPGVTITPRPARPRPAAPAKSPAPSNKSAAYPPASGDVPAFDPDIFGGPTSVLAGIAPADSVAARALAFAY
jgi:hypothetical protein